MSFNIFIGMELNFHKIDLVFNQLVITDDVHQHKAPSWIISYKLRPSLYFIKNNMFEHY